MLYDGQNERQRLARVRGKSCSQTWGGTSLCLQTTEKRAAALPESVLQRAEVAWILTKLLRFEQPADDFAAARFRELIDKG